jgi:hypothetical protein
VLKSILVGTTALALVGSSLVYAQQGPRRGGLDGARRGPNLEDMRAYADARLAALKAGLALTPEQEKNWPAFEQAARELAKLRLDRMTARREQREEHRPGRGDDQQQSGGHGPGDRTADRIDRMRQRGTMMAETGAALKKLADAADPLYKSLDDNQKRRFAVLSRMEGPRAGRGEWHDRDGFRGRRGREGRSSGMDRDRMDMHRGMDRDRGMDMDRDRGMGMDRDRGMNMDRHRGMDMDRDRGMNMDRHRGMGMDRDRGMNMDRDQGGQGSGSSDMDHGSEKL